MKYFEETELSNRRLYVINSQRNGIGGDLLKNIEERLNAYGTRAFIIADEGREAEITRALRRMHVHNPIPSQYGRWPSGQSTRNIVTDRLIEDPMFKQSDRSYFLQIADCIAFSLLKRETPNKTDLMTRFRLDKAFEETVAGICYTPASKPDPLGIVRK